MKSHFPKRFRILITIASYFSLLLLVMKPTASGILTTLVLFFLGLAWIIRKKAECGVRNISLSALLSTAFITFSAGLYFYDQWFTSSKVHSVAAVLNIAPQLLVAVTAVCLSLLSAICVSCIICKAVQCLTELSVKREMGCVLSSCFLVAAVTVMLSQTMAFSTIFSMGYPKFFLEILIVSAAILALYSITSSFTMSVTLGSGLFLIISTINVYVYTFRGRLFEPVDIFSFGTAMNVANNYNLLPIPHTILISWGIWIGILICVFHVNAKVKPILSGKRRLLLAASCLIGCICIFGYSSNLQTYHWNKEGAKVHGYILDYVSKIKEAYIAKPKGYHTNTIEQISQRYPQDSFLSESDGQHPHIIVIMDEAFSDLNVFGELQTNTSVTPFINSMKQDVISGYALTSVYGGNTANSEYEFLTGNSMSFFSPNSVPYQQYLNSPAYSMVSYLKGNYGYRCIAMHPYLSSSWNRPNTYKNFGFDESIFIEDFPQKQYIREYISDQEMFEKIVSIYESKQSQPLFLFGVSMQNHGNYTYEGEDFIQSVSLVESGHEFPEVEQYLSLIHETDKAVEYLISYFSSVEEDVLIVFFGDHQPKLSEEFYAETGQNKSDSLENQQNLYKVPFFVWANYDIDEAYVECTSLNYLSNYVYKAAEIPLPAYNQFLSEMEAAIPAINASGFYSSHEQEYLTFDMASEEEQTWLDLYSQLQYNSLFDENNRNHILFPVIQ